MFVITHVLQINNRKKENSAKGGNNSKGGKEGISWFWLG